MLADFHQRGLGGLLFQARIEHVCSVLVPLP
jgi:hypothetical protein